MSYYGISAIKLDSTGAEVEEAKVHKFSKNASADSEDGLDEGTAMAYHEVASLINTCGDTVFVIVPNDHGGYRHTDKVRVKPGQYEYLESFGTNGTATTALMELPKYQ
ncbi:hypothetical protein [Burkholderia pseudomallei]|uniref:hypothetical protein n=1 Tax=Burkholderia pseudomallei TaxID=28450 RepID=UPI0005C84B68|nr:hypothetical protein [Burkholderia pseudomallei]KIX67123.1 hypothetical protein SZ30_14775 [Burkholderia pseudomallei]